MVWCALFLVSAGSLSACFKDHSPPPPAAPLRRLRPDLAEPPAEKAPAAGAEETALAAVARLFPGADSARTARSRKPIAVLLFAPPGSRVEEGGLAAVPRLRFQPLVCSLRGKLATGARCGEAMPARVKVRLTEAGGALGLEELELVRSTSGFRDDNGNHVYPPPYGPACCMYNTCIGKTVPYYPRPISEDSFLTTDKTILAVWPADAEIDLTVFSPATSEDGKTSEGPWGGSNRDAGDGTPERVSQSVTLQGRRYSFLTDGPIGRGLFVDAGHGAKLLLNELGVREYLMLAGSDIDGDGRPELLVYARWANDYGLQVLANDAPAPVYGFSCGNI